jgi:hypothetical protein
MAIPIPLQEALRDSITSGTFVDTKFWVFSKRSSKTGRVGGPKALFVNGHVVRSVPRLGARAFLLSSCQGFSSDCATVLDQKEANENLRTEFPVHRKPYSSDYDYDVDSDLEGGEGLDSSDNDDPQAAPGKEESDKFDSGTLVGSQRSGAKNEEPLDIISVSDVDSLVSGSSDTKVEDEVAVNPAPTHIGTVVIIDDVAFVT